MLDSIHSRLLHLASIKSTGNLLLYGFIVRLIALSYSILHDKHVDHIKYTDIDYHVFTNGTKAILDGRSPYDDPEYRYPPLVALVFFANILLNENSGKLLLIFSDILCGQVLYTLNIHQGVHRINSKLFLIIWLFNPITIAISTRGSFEPIITLLVIVSVYLLIRGDNFFAGLLYGLTIHIKLYPIIYAISFYFYIVQRKPYMKTQTKVYYWLKTLTPNSSHLKFFVSSGISLLLSSYISYIYYGQDYIEQSFLYHLKRRDTQHNFSVYFALFNLFPEYQDRISTLAFALQFSAVLLVSLLYISFSTNRRVRLRRLTFSLFASTFVFVSLNKVCTSQYFNWYLIFLPLISESIKIRFSKVLCLITTWLLPQAIWLFFAYLYEYQHYDVLFYVYISSAIFLVSNLYIVVTLCDKFDATVLVGGGSPKKWD